MNEQQAANDRLTPSVDVAPEHQSAYVVLFTKLLQWLEPPMVLLAIAWLALLVIELIWGLNPILAGIAVFIWTVFIIEFSLELVLAPNKAAYLRHNWLSLVALLVPALRIFRIAQAFRALASLQATRGLVLVKMITSMNRSMKALRHGLARRGLGYVAALTVLVVFAGAAGMYALENDLTPSKGFDTYATALWWTAMLLTTIGSEYWPQSPAGRLLAFLLSLYGIGVFGYITASLASFLVGRDADNPEAEVAGTRELQLVREELAGLRAELKEYSLGRSD